MINFDQQLQSNIRDKEKMKILYEVFIEYIDKMIADRRAQINRLQDNFNILYAKSERQQLSVLFDDITQLNILKNELAKIMASISLYE